MIILSAIYTIKYHTFIFSVIIKIMLEKNEKNLQNCYCDAHFHYSDCKHDNALDYDNVIIGRDPIISENWYGCTTAHSITEWENQNAAPEKEHLIQAFGMHPQSAGFIIKRLVRCDYQANRLNSKFCKSF